MNKLDSSSLWTLSAIGRPVDLRYPSNRVILALTMLVSMGGAIYQLWLGSGLIQAGLWGVLAGLDLFLAWAIGREIDPDHDLSAFIGAGIALAGFIVFKSVNLATLLWVILILRVVGRSVGIPAKIMDSLGVLLLGGWLTYQDSWIYGLLTAAAFTLDALLVDPQKRNLLFAGAALVLTALIAVINPGPLRSGNLSMLTLPVILGATLLFLPVIYTTRQLTSVCDVTPELLLPQRVRAAQILAVMSALVVSVMTGTLGFAKIFPVWAAILGVSIYWIYSRLMAR